ncbi:hypothetical protein [Streptomyces spororaveus]
MTDTRWRSADSLIALYRGEAVSLEHLNALKLASTAASMSGASTAGLLDG